jgi:hypothetical protein
MAGQLTLIPGGALEVTDGLAGPDDLAAHTPAVRGEDDPTPTNSDKESTR